MRIHAGTLWALLQSCRAFIMQRDIGLYPLQLWSIQVPLNSWCTGSRVWAQWATRMVIAEAQVRARKRMNCHHGPLIYNKQELMLMLEQETSKNLIAHCDFAKALRSETFWMLLQPPCDIQALEALETKKTRGFEQISCRCCRRVQKPLLESITAAIDLCT